MQNLKTKSVKRVYTLTKKNSRKKVNKTCSLFQRFVFFLTLRDKNFLVQSKHWMLNANPNKSLEIGKTI